MRDASGVGADTAAFQKHPGMRFGDLAPEASIGSPAKGAEIALAGNGDVIKEGSGAVVILQPD